MEVQNCDKSFLTFFMPFIPQYFPRVAFAENDWLALVWFYQLVGRVSPNLRSRSLPLTQVKWHSVRHFGTCHPPIPPPPSWWHKILPPSAQKLSPIAQKLSTNCTKFWHQLHKNYHQLHTILASTAQNFGTDCNKFITKCTQF